MTRSGKRRCAAWMALLCLMPALALAAVTAEIDRKRVRLGDSLQLTLTSDGSIDPAVADLSPLNRDFEILQQSSRSSTQIVNGTTTRETALVVELVPRQTGTLEIPALFVGGERTTPISLEVSEAADTPAQDQQVVFTASVDSDSVYVQQQVILTLTLEQAIALDDRSVTELDLDNAYVRPLGQTSYQRTRDGRRWLVHEIRFAVFPEQSGTLTIPPQTFAGRARQGSRSLFDLDSGPRISRSSAPVDIDVRPRPAAFPDSVWLPASELEIQESWSQPPDRLNTGDSVTRTVTITGQGLQGAQLPPLSFSETPGLKYYPDQPSIEETESDSGVIGVRTESAALVAVRPGVYRVPEVRIPWWDTAADRLRYAVLPGRNIEVTPATGTAEDPAGVSTGDQTSPAAPGQGAETIRDAGPWPWISGVLGLGWLLTLGGLLFLIRRQRDQEEATLAAPSVPSDEPRAWKQVQAACIAGDAGRAREALRRWVGTLPAPACEQSLLAFAAAQQDPSFSNALAGLDAALYGPGKERERWQGEALLDAARAARNDCIRQADGASSANGALPPLYPTR